MKNASVPTFDDVARLLAPNKTPAWLSDLLRNWGSLLAKDRDLQEKLPSKSEVRQRLLDVKKAIVQITSTLNDSITMIFVEAESNMEIRNIVQLEISLNHLARAVELAAASPAISEAGGKTKKGRGRAVARTTISPKTFCALIVAEAWLSVRGNRPTLRSQEAAALAQAFWLASGGVASGWGADPRTGWSHHFREARSPAMQSLQTEVQQECTERAQRES